MPIYAKSEGKIPTETLIEHTIHCIDAADKIIDNLPFDENKNKIIKKQLVEALAIHDVGKAAIGFQKSLTEENFWGRRHEILSAAFASTIKGISEESIFAILTHHKTIPASLAENVNGSLPLEQIPLSNNKTNVWEEMRSEWCSNLAMFSEDWKELCNKIQRHDLLNYSDIEYILIDKNWLERGFRQKENISSIKRLDASLLRGLLITCDHLGSAKQVPPSIPILKEITVTKQVLRGFQRRSEIVGDVMIHAPTGSGKTISSLIWAQKNQKKNGRLYYCLPNMASINAMYITLRAVLGNENVGLLHSHATAALYMMMESVSQKQKQYLARSGASMAREMYFPFRVCTPHQVLRYVLRGRGWENMLSEFPNSCFIFDEIHAYEPRMAGLIIATAKFCKKMNASVAFVSATFPKFLIDLIKSNLDDVSFIRPDPNIASDKEILEKKRHALEILGGDLISNLDMIVDAIKKTKNILVVCNHVPTSQLVYDELLSKMPEFKDQIVLLHSRFNRRDRAKLEQRIMNDQPKILISTQVVEVSLNVDYEEAFFEPAPIDALIQRMGRVNRFAKNERFQNSLFSNVMINVHILTNQINNYEIYAEALVQKTLAELKEVSGRALSENELVELADRVYGTGYEGEELKEFCQGLENEDIKCFEEKVVAGTHRDWVEDIIEKSDQTFDVLPYDDLKNYEDYIDEGLFIEASMLLISIHRSTYYKLKQNGLVKKTEPVIVVRSRYDPSKGLVV